MAVRSCFFCPKEQGSSVKDAEGWVTFRPNNADLIRESICFLSKVLDFDELYSVDLDLTIITKGISFCLECVFLFRQVLETYGKLFPLLPKIKANVEMKLKHKSSLDTGDELEEIAVKFEVKDDDFGGYIRNALDDHDGRNDDVEDWSQPDMIKDELDAEGIDVGRDPLEDVECLSDEGADVERDPLEDVDRELDNEGADIGRDPLEDVKCELEDEETDLSNYDSHSPQSNQGDGPPPQKIMKIIASPSFTQEPCNKFSSPSKKALAASSTCTICGESGLWLNHELRTHLKCHTLEASHKITERWPIPVKCPVVSCTFRRPYHHEMWEHLIENHLPILHRCPIPTCNQYFILESTLRAHVALHSSTSSCRCPVCDATLESGPALLEHVRSFHPAKKQTHTCSTCQRVYPSIGKLQCHEKSHIPAITTCEFCPFTATRTTSIAIHTMETHEVNGTLEKKWKCDICEKAYVSKVVLERHASLHKKFDGKGRTLNCEICEYPFYPEEEEKLRRHLEKVHMKVGTVKRCVATECNFTTTTYPTLRQHERQNHPELLTHICVSCGKAYSDQIFLETHLKTHQGGSEPFGCSVCKQVFPSGDKLAAHLAIHNGEVIITCDQCTLTFPSAWNLRAHNISKHNAPSPHTCSICLKKFVGKFGLRHHMDTFHPTETTPTFCCHFCPKIVNSKSQLRTHIKSVHEKSSKTNHICPSCGIKTSDIRMHILRAHTDAEEKAKEKCYFCEKTFVTFFELNLHFATHTNERPYICHICRKDFTQNHCLTAHFKVHKRNGDFFPRPDDYFGIKIEETDHVDEQIQT
ncbi:zinc finger protein 808 isoform X2 [Folsomia candida]|uniref:zinc finger protein 808 isoform X2 n=1 Tax=Folsomia candida TaxID=158441 RepID=UPI000B8F1DE0|nr:zinc finger protein 808 isoform X2 [Folsomia candida]